MCDAHTSVEVFGVTTGLTLNEFQIVVLLTLAVAFSAVMFYIEMLEMRRTDGGDD